MRVLVTGGAGYIGSHLVLELLTRDDLDVTSVTIFDNFTHATGEETIDDLLKALAAIDGKALEEDKTSRGGAKKTSKQRTIDGFQGDLRSHDDLRAVFEEKGGFDLVIHCAGLKFVGDSVKNPLGYYDNNVLGTINLLRVMQDYQCHRLIFSSSTTVYGNPPLVATAFRESSGIKAPVSPYGRTKSVIEDLLTDLANVPDSKWKCVSLRYFNPVGAHPTGLLGERPPANASSKQLFPAILDVLNGVSPHLSIFGSDLATKDGSPARDYIHIMDLVDVHLKTASFLLQRSSCDQSTAGIHHIWNVGCGSTTTVKEVVAAFETNLNSRVPTNASECKKDEKANRVVIPCKSTERRAGDVDLSCANISLVKTMLKWIPKHTLSEAIASACAWNRRIRADSVVVKDRETGK